MVMNPLTVIWRTLKPEQFHAIAQQSYTIRWHDGPKYIGDQNFSYIFMVGDRGGRKVVGKSSKPVLTKPSDTEFYLNYCIPWLSKLDDNLPSELRSKLQQGMRKSASVTQSGNVYHIKR